MLLRWLEEGAVTLCFTLLTTRELFVPGLPCVNLLTRIHCLSDAWSLLFACFLGVFPALRKGYLSMFMIGIYTDPEQPEKLLEGW